MNMVLKTFLLMHYARNRNAMTPTYIKSLAASNSRIRFINLPPSISFSPSQEANKSIEKIVTEFIGCHKASVKEVIVKHVVSSSDQGSLARLVVDYFYTSMIDKGNELGVPSYLFFPSGAPYLGLLLHGLPEFLLNKYGGYTTLMNHGRRFKETNRIIVNTFEELESHAVKSLLKDFENVLPVYTVEPVIDVKGRQSEKLDLDEIMKCLDDPPDSSVVFLCFGSWGSFGEEQVKEIALGL
ncbi:UDP-glycosyltransferase 71K1-like [Pistacia vera]|uniref:UDP-glycosyltransferase 71K1-like n=1 Tax=Pistacia vera TaxID=55513 RepID=UPI0012635996|nr:UDP-glycosyltransferase 71K1-like [Pistacia vera]